MVSAPYGLDLQNITKNLLMIMHILVMYLEDMNVHSSLLPPPPFPHFQFNWFIRFIIVLIVGSG